MDPEDVYRLDLSKSPAENAFEIYSTLCSRDIREAKRLFLLNGLATLLQNDKKFQLEFTTEEILYW